MATRYHYEFGTPANATILAKRLFPTLQSLSAWATLKVAPVESPAPNEGRYVWTLDDTNGLDWAKFPSDSAPANWSSGVPAPLSPIVDVSEIIDVIGSVNINVLSAIADSFMTQRYAARDTFDDVTDLMNIDNRVLPTCQTNNLWLLRVGQQKFFGVDFGGEHAVHLPTTDFNLIGTYYTVDPGLTSYILHVRASTTASSPARVFFRCSRLNNGYFIEWIQNGASSALRIYRFDTYTPTLLKEVTNANAPTLTSGAWYDIYVVVAGSRVRAFVGGFPYLDISMEIVENVWDTHVGIGARYANTYFQAFESIPIAPANEAASIHDRIALLEASTEIIATSVPLAMAPVQAELETLITERTLATADYVTDAELAARTLPTANYATMDALGDLDFSPLAAQLTDIQETLSDLGPVPQWLPPVAPSGQIIAPIIIGDDYLVANGRAFTWLVAAIAGVDPLTSTFRFGGQRIIRPENNWLVTGTVAVVDASTWRLTAELPKVYTESLAEGPYRFSGEVVSNTGVEITRIQSGSNLVQLVKKQT